ncbi:cobalt transporter subunit CbtB [Nocardioides ginsengisegetis]|uniref:Cobalt transporter subunit CbtB n=1 Tax=Nocardioides ginsengisegetis TaxID=661491 RepID=A0A7W3PAK7_9ACTN|nr:cobalt transporter subunit CbtB [Nocardioides ginsengisegetis]
MNAGNQQASIGSEAVTVVPTWVWALAAIAVLLVVLLTQENGTLLSASAANFLHEVTHDGRHAFGVPCH